MLARSKTGPMLPAAALTAALLTTGCVTSGGSGTTETERAMCRELQRDLPTYSARDTEATKEAGVGFLTTFRAICG